MLRPRLASAGALVVLAALACGGNGGDDGTGTTSASTGTGGATGTGATTFADGTPCAASEECATTGSCVAPYDPAAGEGGPGRGPAECIDACIELDDLARWCLDDDACCGDLRCNVVDGFCLPGPSLGSTSSSSSSGGSDASGGSGSSSGDGGSDSSGGSGTTGGSDTGTR